MAAASSSMLGESRSGCCCQAADLHRRLCPEYKRARNVLCHVQRAQQIDECARGSYVDWIVTGPATAIWLGLIAGADTTDIVGAVSGIGTALPSRLVPHVMQHDAERDCSAPVAVHQ